MCILACLKQSKKLMSLQLNRCTSLPTVLRGNEDLLLGNFISKVKTSFLSKPIKIQTKIQKFKTKQKVPLKEFLFFNLP